MKSQINSTELCTTFLVRARVLQSLWYRALELYSLKRKKRSIPQVFSILVESDTSSGVGIGMT